MHLVSYDLSTNQQAWVEMEMIMQMMNNSSQAQVLAHLAELPVS